MDNGSERPKPDAQKAQIEALMISFGAAYFAAILALGIFAWTLVVKGIVGLFYGHLDDAQKAQIEAIFIPHRPAPLAALRLGGAGAWGLAVVGIVRVFSDHGEPSSADVVAMAVLFAISLVPVAIWLQWRRLQPVLAGLPLTQERITRADRREDARAVAPLSDSDDAAQEEEAIARLLKRELERRGHFNGPIDDV